MKEQISEIKERALQELAEADSSEGIEEVRIRFLGKKGQLTTLLRQIGQLSKEERPAIGQAANEARKEIEAALTQARERLQKISKKEEEPVLDFTMPGSYFRLGKLHPLTKVIREICDIFVGMGYQVVEGPEIETEYYNFTALNFPPDHPVLDEHDSFYIREALLLRTETSAVQIRVMEKQEPPVRVISPGRCYRRDAVDATHSHTFHQVEGLCVDEGIRFSDLIGTLQLFAQQMFGEGVKMRFRPDYFPFTEPSADAAISCFICQQKGCRVCSNTGWLEILGCGMVHPKVLENVGYDPEKVTGFAFGMGAERIAMLKYGIPDIRLFYENDIRFLRQF